MPYFNHNDSAGLIRDGINNTVVANSNPVILGKFAYEL